EPFKMIIFFVTVYLARNINKSNGFRNKCRKNESYEGKYIKGKYGAIPFLGDFEHLFPEPLAVSGHEDEG
ncbi:MAG: hypothetical protein KI786_18540, partial [Mameliella sp.]|nr:hypothetical protein [Phaeodactylibacter sp.]